MTNRNKLALFAPTPTAVPAKNKLALFGQTISAEALGENLEKLVSPAKEKRLSTGDDQYKGYQFLGIDVGSTTVKAYLMDDNFNCLWCDYQPHETRQPEKTLEFLELIEKLPGVSKDNLFCFITGSGGGVLASMIGAQFVQEVNAVSLAVRRLYPEIRSVIELGGQDAKIIIYKEDPKTGLISTIPSMNDKCASGTGATIEKIGKKIGMPLKQLAEAEYLPYSNDLVHIASKCGVFAETDVIGHLKGGLSEKIILASVFESIVTQNLNVLTRGHTLKPKVLLLGGPNNYLPGLVDAWKTGIIKIWKERGVFTAEQIKTLNIDEEIILPKNAQYFAAMGSIFYGMDHFEELKEKSRYKGTFGLNHYITVGREVEKQSKGQQGLWTSEKELQEFKDKYTPAPFHPQIPKKGEIVSGFLGIDGGSTSTKAVLIDASGQILAKSYILSEGNPIKDTMDCIGAIERFVQEHGATLDVKGLGTTGYAKDVLKDVFGGDVGLVETVAHMRAAQHFYGDIDVIVDVGGQDIKLIFLAHGRVKDFRLNTQCSAGNGYFLQSTAERFGVKVTDFASEAFKAKSMPSFGYGCAVFMESDIVNFQKEGWRKEEILAGLANVLPKNIWLYVSKIPNVTSLGKRFILQGGTQYNLAAVKAQVDFLQTRFQEKGVVADVFVHKHCGEAGAIGAALESAQLIANGATTQFIGLSNVKEIEYIKTSDERTRCNFCKNNCLRTFIDVKMPSTKKLDPNQYPSKVTIPAGYQRVISGFSCMKGTVESAEQAAAINKKMTKMTGANPNLVAEMATSVFESPVVEPAILPYSGLKKFFYKKHIQKTLEARNKRGLIKIGMPKVLNMYSHAPFFLAYFLSLGLSEENLIFSSETTPELVQSGLKRGSVDPCFPSKVCLAHVNQLLMEIHKKNKLDFIFFPMVDSFPSPLKSTVASRACPTVTGSSEMVKAAYTKEEDLFKKHGTKYFNPWLNLDCFSKLKDQMFTSMHEELMLTKEENDLAVEQGLKALSEFQTKIENRSQVVIDDLIAKKKVGLVMLGRPYHHDKGLNHEILLKIQRMGYPILSIYSLPYHSQATQDLFKEDIEAKIIDHHLEIKDIWTKSYSENTNIKLWASKYVARHPNLVGIELSSFKCGHDAPIYSKVEEQFSKKKALFFTFRDLDENNPSGSINVRLETMKYFLDIEEQKLK